MIINTNFTCLNFFYSKSPKRWGVRLDPYLLYKSDKDKIHIEGDIDQNLQAKEQYKKQSKAKPNK